jgi:aryl-alcohol dehydrogenase-like predicted oxidoreductase
MDPRVELVESLEPILEAQRAGRIRWVGLSNVSMVQLGRALKNGTVDAVQNRLSVGVRPEGSQEMVHFCGSQGIVFVAYTPFGPTLDEGDRRRVRDAGPVRHIAAERRVSPEIVALAWLLALSPTLHVIPGARSPEAICDSIRALSINLNAEELRELSAYDSDSDRHAG